MVFELGIMENPQISRLVYAPSASKKLKAEIGFFHAICDRSRQIAAYLTIRRNSNYIAASDVARLLHKYFLTASLRLRSVPDRRTNDFCGRMFIQQLPS